MAGFNEQLFEKKLLNLKDTQDSISGLSSWCLQQPQHHKKIVQTWLQVLKKVKIEQRLSLFYLANDVIQYSKRKGYDFVESWGTALQRATTMVRGEDKVRTKILRLFTIWNERNIYDESFLVDLVGLLSSRTPAQTSAPDAQDFQPATLISKIRSCKALEDDTDFRLRVVNDSPLSLSDVDALRSSLKDRRHGDDVVADVEDGIDKMEAYIRAMELEIKERQELLELLDLADVFYETQKGEARIVCNAYRNFGMRVKSLKRKVDDLIPTLASPIPSPDINAPSPSPESDLDLPDDVKHGLGNMGMSSFIGTAVIPELSEPELRSPTQLSDTLHHSEHQPLHHLQSINMHGSQHANSRNLEEVPIQLPNINEPPPPPPPPLPVHHPILLPQHNMPPQMSVPPPLSVPPRQHVPPPHPIPIPHNQHTVPPPQHSIPPPQHSVLPPPQHSVPPPMQHSVPPPSQHSIPPPLQHTVHPPPQHPVMQHTVPPPPPPPPQHSSFISPLSSYNRSEMPPLLGDGQDFPLNGGDSFLSHSTGNHSPVPPFLGTDLSFIGNSDFQFDFQKSDFLRDNKHEMETPLSPPPENMPDDSLSDELSHNVSKEGKPIEVISTTKNESTFNLTEFLNSLMPKRDGSHLNRSLSKDQVKSPIDLNTPLMDASVPPPNIDESFQRKQWNSTLPPKFPSWSDSQASWGDGMNSPPGYKEGFGNSIDYEIPASEESHEEIDVPRPVPAVDIDHRNLISLTGSPLNNDNNWPHHADVDYRKPLLDNRDIVESVDMEMSDDEEPVMQGGFPLVKLKPPPPVLLTPFHRTQLNRKMHKPDTRGTLETLTGGQNQSISFNIQNSSKLLSESPLKEQDEPKRKLSLHRLNSPPRNIMNLSKMMPPPPPPLNSGLNEVAIASHEIRRESIEDDLDDTPDLEDDQINFEQDENINTSTDDIKSPFSERDTDLRFKNDDQNVGETSSPSETGFNSGVEMDDNVSDADDVEDNQKTANEENNLNEIRVNEEHKWLIKPLLNTLPPPIMSNMPNIPPAPLLNMPPSPGFRPRGMRGGQMPWRGPRRGMPHRFRSPGGMPPLQGANFQAPRMGPRGNPFRGNHNWRPRHW